LGDTTYLIVQPIKNMSVSVSWETHELNHVEDCPTIQATVKFGDLAIADIGQITTPTHVQNPPSIQWGGDKSCFYAVFMTDPDAPSRKDQKFGEWYHWGVINIPGEDKSKGEVIAQYVGAGPPEGTGLHRYLILVYKQEKKIEFKGEKLVMKMANRNNTNMRKFAKDLGIGSPVAGSCFQAEWDDYVPKLYAKFQD